MHGEWASPLEFVVILTKLVKLKIFVYLVFFMNVKFLFSTFCESSMSIKIIVVLNMLVPHVPFHEYKFLFAIIFFKFAIIFLNTCVPHLHSTWLLLSSNNGFRQVLMLHYYCYQLLMSWQNSYTMEYIM